MIEFPEQGIHHFDSFDFPVITPLFSLSNSTIFFLPATKIIRIKFKLSIIIENIYNIHLELEFNVITCNQTAYHRLKKYVVLQYNTVQK